MDRNRVVALLMETELELQAAQREHNGTHAATERYRAARARHVQAERLAVALLDASEVLLARRLRCPAGSRAGYFLSF